MNGLPPWIERRFQLVTWMDVLKFSAGEFYKIGGVLSGMEEILYDAKPNDLIRDEQREKLSLGMQKLSEYCGQIGLSMSVLGAQRLASELQKAKSYIELKGQFKELDSRIQDEVSDHLFLYIPKPQSRFFEEPQLFGKQVETAFPSTLYDIAESGKCLALNRGTACVFHAMRVLESGLKALASEFSIPINHKAWGQIIDNIEQAIKNIPRDPNKPSDWQEHRQFCSEAAVQFLHFKDAWRNYTAHLRFKYTEDEAEAIHRHVGDFMKHLSKRLKEPETT